MRTAVVLWLCLAVVPTLAAPASPVVHLPGGERPPILAALPPLDGLTALALAPGGRRAAIAVGDPSRRSGGLIRVVNLDRDDDVETRVPGIVRDLVWVDGGAGLLALVHRPAKRHEGRAELVDIDLTDGGDRRRVRVAPSAAAVEPLPGTNVLLLPARDGIRTVVLPDLRSGPLFRLVGDNTSIASLGGTRLLVGRADGLLVLDLDDPPGEDGIPVRERIAVDGRVVDLAAGRDGIVARLADGRVLGVALAPLRIDARELAGVAAVAAVPAPSTAEPRAAVPTPRELRPAPTPAIAPPTVDPDPDAAAVRGAPSPDVRPAPPAAPERPAPPAPEPVTVAPVPVAPTPVPTESPAPVPAAPRPDRPEPVTTESPTPVPAAPMPVRPEPVTTETSAQKPVAPVPAAPESVTPAPVPPRSVASEPAAPVAPPPPRVDAPGMTGSVVGPAADAVVHVVLFGPDNLLREAARVRVDGGRWGAGGLAPGRYRVQLDGGPDRVIVAEPPFAVVEIRGDAVIAAPTIRALRVL